jgi:hypothetical protein
MSASLLIEFASCTQLAEGWILCITELAISVEAS